MNLVKWSLMRGGTKVEIRASKEIGVLERIEALLLPM